MRRPIASASVTISTAVVENPFSNLYTHVAKVTGLPRTDVKAAIIAKFLGEPEHPVWQTIVAKMKEKVSEEI